MADKRLRKGWNISAINYFYMQRDVSSGSFNTATCWLFLIHQEDPMFGYQLSRRAACSGLLALAASPSFAATGGGRRTFDVYRGDSPIGSHVLSVRQQGDRVLANTDVNIAVKVLGFTAYRYTLSYAEEYDLSGNLLSLKGTCNDDGDPDFVNVTRQGDTLMIEGSGYNGSAPGSAYPTSYWMKPAINNSPWISTQSGELLNVSVSPMQVAEAPSGATSLRAADGAGFNIDLFLDAQGEWIGSAFDAKGERATYRLTDNTGPLSL